MQVILKEDVPALGKAGDVVKVAEGFGRNFLLPQKKAITATPSGLKELEHQRTVIEAKREKIRQSAQEIAQKIEALVVKLTKQAGEEDKIFGSVSLREITANLLTQGITIDKRDIRLKEPIRKLGEHVAKIHLHSDVVASLKIEVVKE